MKNKNKIFLLLLLIILLGLFLRIYKLDSLTLWYDEFHTIYVSKNFFNFIPKYITYEEGYYNNLTSSLFNEYAGEGLSLNPPFYFFIMNIWIKLFGTSEIALRSFSVLVAVLSIFFIYLLGKYFFGNKIGLLSAFLFAINPYNIMYSQEARTYTLIVLLGLISSYYFIKSLDKNKLLYWFIFIITNAIGLYTHTFFIFIIFFEILYFILFIKKYKNLIKNFILSLFLICFLYLPWFPHFYYANLYANKFFWLDIFNWVDVPLTLIVFGIGQTLIVKESQLHNIVIITFLYLIGFTIPFLISLKRINRKIIFLFLYLFIPIIIPAILSIISRPVFQWQYIMIACPAFYILIAKGLTNINKKLYYLFLIIIIILSFSSLIHYYTTPIFKGDYRAATKFIKNNEKPGDLILIHSPQIISVFKYYYEGDLLIKGFPDILQKKLNEENIKITDIKDIDPIIKDYKRVWLIQRLVKDKEETIPDYLDKTYKRVYFNKFVWVRVYLYIK